MASLFQSGKYGVINTYDTTTDVFYVNKFISEAYRLQNNTTMTDNLFLWMNYLSRHNIFYPFNKILIVIGRNNQYSILS